MPVLTITRYCCLSLCVLLTSRAFINAQNPNREGLVSAGKLQVHYEVHGAGAPLVFIHAGYQDLSMWDQQVTFFKKFNTVITVDLPGHGGTTGVDTSLLVQDVLRILLDSLHIQTASFAGLSMGGSCVTDFVLAYPERVNKVVLVSSGLSGWSDVLTMDTVSRQCFGQMDRISTSNNLDSFASAFCRIWCIGLKRNADAVPAAIRDYVFRTTLENLREHPEANRWPQMAQPRAADRMQQWQKPLLIITGDQDLPFILAVAAWMHATVKGSATVVIPHTAHMLNMENPLLFNKTVHSFLQD